jgi:4-carboxymuconolactone decarboxylase
MSGHTGTGMNPHGRSSTMTQRQSAAQQAIGDVAPKLADLTDQALFGDVRERLGLSKRDRSLVTVPV